MGNDKKALVLLNVGGTYYLTTRSTLMRSPPTSPLHRISSHSTNVDFHRDEKGAYVIDRDPEYFQTVLNFLRHGKLIVHHHIPDEAILLEAEYFHLHALALSIKTRIAQRLFHQRLTLNNHYSCHNNNRNATCISNAINCNGNGGGGTGNSTNSSSNSSGGSSNNHNNGNNTNTNNSLAHFQVPSAPSASLLSPSGTFGTWDFNYSKPLLS